MRQAEPMIPQWLTVLAAVSLILAATCGLIIAVDVIRHPQRMAIMNIVWPVTALYGSPVALWFYWRYGQAAARDGGSADRVETPPRLAIAKGSAHCGAGCTLGDIGAEWLAWAVPAVAVGFGWRTIFGEKLFAVWLVDYVFAFAFGIAFQYFTIQPMRRLSVGRGLVEAMKADAASLTSWQVGMYGFMAFANFVLFRDLLGTDLPIASAVFWFMMQIAMVFGFAASYPVNAWLIGRGIKERM